MQEIQIVDFGAIIVSLFFFALGSFFDLKTREVDDKVWLAYGPIGVALTILRLLIDPSNAFTTLASIALTILISLGLFYFGLFGGADSKAIICLGVTMPLPPTTLQPLLGYVHPFFPVVAMITGFLCSASVAVWIGLRNLLAYMRQGRSMFEGLEREAGWRKAMALILGYRTEISKLRSTFYLYPMEEVVANATGSHRALKLYQDAEADREPMVSEFSKSITQLGYEGRVWVTPGLPMLVFIFIGLVLTLVLGDVIFATVLQLAVGGRPALMLG